ncbi:MAG: phytanoyl-CoA dioxygenase [Flavobacteriales bacterium]|nr:phytanoyl-CoA dioxygenase [Flavobacteriales bacterium]
MSELEFYNENGYVLKQSFFDTGEVANILNEAKGVFLKQFQAKGYFNDSTLLKDISEKGFNSALFRLFQEDFQCLSNCGKQVQHLIDLHRLSLDERIVRTIRSLGMEVPVVSTRPVLFFNHPNLAKEKVYYQVDAHQDWRSMQGSLNSMVVWIPLVDVPLELGALQVLPKSHLMGLRTDHLHQGFGMVKLTPEEEKSLVSVEVKAGDALFFSSFLIHQSGQNTSENPRWSTHFRYNDLNEPTFVQRGYPHAYIYRPVGEQLTPDFPSLEQVKATFK